MQTLGQRVKELREKLGLTQEELADLVHITDGYVGLIERDERMPSKSVMQLLAKALHTTTLDLQIAAGVVENVIKELKGLGPNLQACIIRMARFRPQAQDLISEVIAPLVNYFEGESQQPAYLHPVTEGSPSGFTVEAAAYPKDRTAEQIPSHRRKIQRELQRVEREHNNEEE